MNEKALGFCGSTTIAYGAIAENPTLCCADLLVQYFLQAVQSGTPLGPALVQAKSQLVNAANQANGTLDAQTEKTLLQFVVYGDPSSLAFQPAATKGLPGAGPRLLSMATRGELSKAIRN